MSKRKQVKNACGMSSCHALSQRPVVNCQRACKKCDDQRPCERCSKYGLEDSCRDSARKERKKGSRRGGYSRLVDDDGISEDDEEDGISSSRWSDDIKSTAKASPSGYSVKIKFDDGRSETGRYFSQGEGRPMRSARSKPVRYDNEYIHEQQQRPAIHVGASDATFIKALGAVCTEVLRKIEEEDLPQAVTYNEWPPKNDTYFAPVTFRDRQQILADTQMSLAPMMQPIPLQRIQPHHMLESALSGEEGTAPPAAVSSPMEMDTVMSRPNYDIMTPPETPVNITPESLKMEQLLKKTQEGFISLPTIKGLKNLLNSKTSDH